MPSISDAASLKAIENIILAFPGMVIFLVRVFSFGGLIIFLVYMSFLLFADKKKMKYILNQRIESDLMMLRVVYPPNWVLLIFWIVGVIAWFFIPI